MLKKQKMSKKSTINRDTLLIVQIFVLILLIFLIIKQVNTFKNNKLKHKEGFLDNETDTVILHTEDPADSAAELNNIIRLGYLEKIIPATFDKDNTLTVNFNLSTLATYNLYNKVSGNTTYDETSSLYKDKSVTNITILDEFSVILYEGNNFNNDKRSKLIIGPKIAFDLRNHFANDKYEPVLSSLKVFRTALIDKVIKREANFNNQILLFENNNLGPNGEISRINLPKEKMDIDGNGEEIQYKYKYDDKVDIKPINYICLPGPDATTGDYDSGVYRNISLTLIDTGKSNKNPIIKTGALTSPLTNIKNYIITPKVPTLDTFTALDVIKNNMVQLESLEGEFKKMFDEAVVERPKTKEKEDELIDKLASSFMKKFDKNNNRLNHKIDSFKL